MIDRAVFLDRDGVLNHNVLNEATGEWEGPHRPEDLQLYPWTIASLRKLQDADLHLFLISNQPSYAKGKATFESLTATHAKLHNMLTDNKIYFSDYFYCYHHPKGIVPELTIKCECRKPGTFFIEKAAQEHSLNLKASWIVGDRDLDIECGQNAGLRTIRVLDAYNPQKVIFNFKPDFNTGNLGEAVNIILNNRN